MKPFNFIVLGLIFSLASCAGEKPQGPLLSREFTVVGKGTLNLELARTREEQRIGMMFRTQVGPLEGMLFVYKDLVVPTAYSGGFWMKNCPLPLSIAFISPKGEILEIRDMQPFDETTVTPSFTYQYALEMGQGNFAKLGIRVGDRLDLSPLRDL